MTERPSSNCFNGNEFVRQEPSWILHRDEYAAIDHHFSSLEELEKTVNCFDPESFSVGFLGPSSKVPHGIVCIRNAFAYLAEAQWLLRNAFCFLSYINNLDKDKDLFILRIYFDDACLRLYSSAEHLACAIVKILEISLEKKSDKTMSLAIRVGEHFSSIQPSHKLSSPIRQLVSSQDWSSVIKWRNNWVHDKRLIPEESPEYRRGTLWEKTSDKSYELALTVNEQVESDLEFEKILQISLSALNSYIVCFSEVVTYLNTSVQDSLKKRGIIITKET